MRVQKIHLIEIMQILDIKVDLYDGAGYDLFSDIVELEMQCKFSDCLHETEPGCAVKKAIRGGTLSNKRLESYRKLQREMQAVERKKNPKLAEKKKWKDIKKMAKEIKKTRK